MKIENLKINAYGKLENKKIEFSDHINIIHGNNESGKSTLLNFISNIFYGTSKNKKGKEYSDYDKYKPWNSEEFSGKITYRLDNGKKYEVFREFGGKKTPKIYNEQKEDISKQYSIDKNFGNQFFTEQTGVNEMMFLSTVVSMQQEIKLDKNVQNALVQKVANLASTGDDSVSYKKAQEKITKKQIEEIGTNRSQGRPINIIKEEKFKIQDEIGKLENCKERKKEIEYEKEEIKSEIVEIERNIQLIRKIKEIKEKERLSKEKIKIAEDLKQNQEQRMEVLELQKNEIEKNIQKVENVKKVKEKVISKTKRNVALGMAILGIILLIISIIIKNVIIAAIFGIEFVFTGILGLIEIKKINKAQKKQATKKIEIQKQQLEKEKAIRNWQEEINKIEAEITVLQNNINTGKEKIQEVRQKEQTEIALEIENLKNEAENQKIERLFNTENINYELEKQEEKKNRKNLEYRSLELEENAIFPELEKVVILEEQLEEINEKEKELEEKNKAIELTREILEIAYKKMKQNVTPKLTQELSKNIQEISGGKYSKINLHEEEGIIVEKENGEYVEADKLSVRNN